MSRRKNPAPVPLFGVDRDKGPLILEQTNLARFKSKTPPVDDVPYEMARSYYGKGDFQNLGGYQFKIKLKPDKHDKKTIIHGYINDGMGTSYETSVEGIIERIEQIQYRPDARKAIEEIWYKIATKIKEYEKNPPLLNLGKPELPGKVKNSA